jgi:hypothetical protein
MATTGEELLTAIKSYVTGMVKGNTTDVVGAPVDLINELVIRPIATALGKEDSVSKEPVGGSKSIRKLFGLDAEDKNVAETIGSLISMSAPVKAMIVPALVTKSLKEVRDAEKKIRAGEAETEVFRTTGIFSPPYNANDGILRTVISDADASLNLGPLTPVKKELNQILSWKNPTMDMSLYDHTVTPLDKLLDHPKLFDAVPELRTVKVGPASFADNGGFFNRDENYIGIGRHHTPEQFLSTLLHEIQHAVQNQFGMTGGGNPKQFLERPKEFSVAVSRLEEMKRDAFKAQKAEAAKRGEDIYKPSEEFKNSSASRRLEVVENSLDALRNTADNAYKSYRSIYGEAEAFGVEKLRANPELAGKPPHSYYDNPKDFIEDPGLAYKHDEDPVIKAIIESAIRNPKALPPKKGP